MNSASKTGAIFAIVNAVATIYTIGFAAFVPASKYLQKDVSVRWFYVFLASMTFKVALPFIPLPDSKKWLRDQVKRNKAMSVAVAQLTNALDRRSIADATVLEITQRLLSSVKSEIEALTGDKEGLYLNVSLLVQELDDPLTLTVFCRANQDRENPSYKKNDLIISECLADGSLVYCPDVSFDGKPYRSIMGMGLVSELPSGKTNLGILSIDSSEPHHFDGLEDKIETTLLTYTSLLKLVIVVARIFGERRGNGRKRNAKTPA